MPFGLFKKRNEEELAVDAGILSKKLISLEEELIKLLKLKKRIEKGEFLQDRNLSVRFEISKERILGELYKLSQEILKFAKDYERLISKKKNFDPFFFSMIGEIRVALNEFLDNPKIDYEFLRKEAPKTLSSLEDAREKLAKRVKY